MMVWPANSLWAITGRRVYHNGRQFSGLADLWKAIEKSAASVTPTEILKLTSSVDSSIVKSVQNGGVHVSAYMLVISMF